MLTPADYVSLGNALMGLIAVFLISLNHLEAAVALILVAILGDGLDGFLARKGYGGGPFGSACDSFADLLAFGVAPAALLFHSYYQWEIITEVRGPDILTALAVGAAGAGYLLAGVLRLIRFEVIQGSGRSDFFVGLSIPAAALFVTLPTFMNWSPRLVLPLVALAAFLMVGRVKFPKIRGALAPPVAVLILGTLVLGRQLDQSAPLILFSFIATYLAMGPLFVRWRRYREEGRAVTGGY